MAGLDEFPELRRVMAAHSNRLETIARVLKSAAQRYAPNSHVSSSISVENESMNDTTVRITLRACSVDARAYEYGSGVHSRRAKKSPRQMGPKGKILIEPVEKQFLAFFWEKATDKQKSKKTGKVVFRSVQHPGVAPANNGEGYLRKAVKETKKQIKADLKQGIAGAVKQDIKAKFLFGEKSK